MHNNALIAMLGAALLLPGIFALIGSGDDDKSWKPGTPPPVLNPYTPSSTPTPVGPAEPAPPGQPQPAPPGMAPAPPPPPGPGPVPPGRVPPPGPAPAPPGSPPPPGPAPAYIPPSQILQDVKNIIAMVNSAKPYFQCGGVWATRAPGGEIEVKAAVVYQSTAVAVIRFDPVTGEVLPMGYNPRRFEMRVDLTTLRNRADQIIKELEVLPGAEYREPEAAWAVPVAYQGKIVGHVKVLYNGQGIVPDYPADQEMRLYSTR